MVKLRRISRYFLFIIRKLGYLILSIVIFNLMVVFLFNCLFLHLEFGRPLFVLFIPIISFFIFFTFNQIRWNFRNNMAHYKYSLYFPFIFYDDPKPKKSERIDMKMIRESIRPGDVILRRYDSYIDGLIFSENSYFTHAGIYCSDYKGFHDKVLHAEAQPGVHDTSLDSFCNCDDIAILRFSFNRTEQEKDILRFIKNEHRPKDADEIKNREELIFNKLMDINKSDHNDNILQETDSKAKGYANLILDRAISLLKTPYDLEFDFTNFSKLSCIEYVWYCFKFLYPLHRINVNDFEFFQIIKIPVIVPDVFIRNDFFDYVYSSVPNVKDKKTLIEKAKPDHWQFWKFILSIVIWDVVFLYISVLLFHPDSPLARH